MNIQIAKQSEVVQDISQINEISEPLDIPVSITPDPVPTIVQNQKEDGTIEDITINVPQPSKITNLRVEQQRLQEMQEVAANAQARADEAYQVAQTALYEANAIVAKQQALVDEMSRVATEAVQAVEIVPVKEVTPLGIKP